MGRSVMVPRNAAAVVYFPTPVSYDDEGEFDYDLSAMDWDDMVANIKGVVGAASESFSETDEWQDEMHAIARNDKATVVLSEYCGLCALALVPVPEPPEDKWYADAWTAFAEQWIGDYEPALRQELEGIGLELYRRVGGFSNGESVYEAVR